MVILYGGAFNPPTIAHLAIIKYLRVKYPNSKLLVMPTNNKYKNESLIDYHHRYKMVELLVKGIPNIEVSNFELVQNDKYLGTADTLAKLNHPFFVMGADALRKIDTWINPENLIKDNHFLVFPRDGINILEIIDASPLLSKYRDHFVVIDDFKEINCSSTAFRIDKDYKLVTKEVLDYIKQNHLYFGSEEYVL